MRVGRADAIKEIQTGAIGKFQIDNDDIRRFGEFAAGVGSRKGRRDFNIGRSEQAAKGFALADVRIDDQQLRHCGGSRQRVTPPEGEPADAESGEASCEDKLPMCNSRAMTVWIANPQAASRLIWRSASWELQAVKLYCVVVE